MIKLRAGWPGASRRPGRPSKRGREKNTILILS